MKVLWFSNIRLNESTMNSSGTWIEGMSDLLLKYHPEVFVANVTRDRVESIVVEKVRGRQQWVVPLKVSQNSVDVFQQIIDSFAPDIIHIWGTELYWAAIPFGLICPAVPCILEMQGLYSSVLDILYGDLTLKELLRCYSIKEFLRPQSSLFLTGRRMKRYAEREESSIRAFNIISVQSNWVKGYVSLLNPNAAIYNTKIALRKGFYSSQKWSRNTADLFTIFTISSMREPSKGIYTMLKAFAEVHRLFPKARLIVAGVYQTGLRRSGFQRLMEKFIRKNNLCDAISFTGILDTNQLIQHYLSANVFVNPSYVESYSLVVAESTFLGVPTVACYAGALGELGEDNSVLYFPKYDYKSCAHQIVSVLSQKDLCESLSERSRSFSSRKHNPEEVARTQKFIYTNIYNNR